MNLIAAAVAAPPDGIVLWGTRCAAKRAKNLLLHHRGKGFVCHPADFLVLLTPLPTRWMQTYKTNYFSEFSSLVGVERKNVQKTRDLKLLFCLESMKSNIILSYLRCWASSDRRARLRRRLLLHAPPDPLVVVLPAACQPPPALQPPWRTVQPSFRRTTSVVSTCFFAHRQVDLHSAQRWIPDRHRRRVVCLVEH